MLRRKMLKLETSHIAFISSFLILIGLFFLSYNYVQEKKIVAYQYMDRLVVENKISENKNIVSKKETIPKDEKVYTTLQTPEVKEVKTNESLEKKEEKSSSISYHYIGYLNIPKIKLRRGLVDKDSSDNNVEKNLFIASSSTYPDVDKGNLIIAGHSGTGYKAFFKNLYKLEIGDTAQVEYSGKVYHYRVVKIYEQDKTGKIAIYRNYDKTTLTLVTCTKDKENKQTVYILELANIE